MRILAAGGTGFLGRHIVRDLLDDGHEVRVLSRDPSRSNAIRELQGASSVRGDVTDPASLPAAMEGVDAIVGVVAFPNFPVEQPRKKLTFYNYDYVGSENLLAAAKSTGVKRYAYISGAGADATSEKSWYRAKGLAEDAIERSGLSYFILRPSWAYGPEDKALNRYVTMARFLPAVPKLGVRPQRIRPVYVKDIALSVQRAFASDGDEGVWDRTFEVGGPDVMTMDEVIKTLLDVLGKKRPIVPIPTLLAKIATAPLSLLPTPPMNPTGVEFAVQDGLVDTTDLEKILDVHPVGLREGLREYLGSHGR